MTADEFWEIKTREEREKILKEMTNEQIDLLIQGSNIIQSKIYLSSFKK